MRTAALTRRDVQLLLGEARRYLAVVDTFRAEGCEPVWRPERAPAPATRRRAARLALGPASIP
jgi:hypothetical protein